MNAYVSIRDYSADLGRSGRLCGAAMCGLLFLLSGMFSPNAARAALPKIQPVLVAKPYNMPVAIFEEVPGNPFNTYEVVPVNLGGAPTAEEATATIRFSPGVTFRKNTDGKWNCSGENAGLSEITCSSSYPEVPILLTVDVSAATGPVATTEVELSGAGSPLATDRITNPVADDSSPFAIQTWSSAATGLAGESYDLAAGHPFSLSNLFQAPVAIFSQVGQAVPVRSAARNIRDLVVDLPPGLIGNPMATSRCPIQTFLSNQPSPFGCPLGSEVGSFILSGSGTTQSRAPIFNLDPEPGFPAEFGFFDTELDHGVLAKAELVHSANGYVIQFVAPDLPKGAVAGPWFLQALFQGEPGIANGIANGGKPFLTMPSSCSAEPLDTAIHIDTWLDPALVPVGSDGRRNVAGADFDDPRWLSAVSQLPAVEGCSELKFEPSLGLVPETTTTDSPTGIKVNLRVPQNEEPRSRATPPLRDAKVVLPKGMAVDPSVASGLLGCGFSQLDPDSTIPGTCPEGSKIGTASLQTALVDHPLDGSVYVGAPDCSPCSDADAAAGRLLKLYVEIDDPSTGVVVKLPGSVAADPATGQLTASFVENPQLPFEDLELNLKSGSRAPLTTPPTCGSYTTTSDLEPWSAPQSGPDAAPQSRFQITGSPAGGACPTTEGGLSEALAFEAGSTLPLAGSYSPFVLKVSRENGSQRISSLEATLPDGLLGRLAGIPYCSDASIARAANESGAAEQANPSCPAQSEVGVVNVGVGSGTPFSVKGHAYLAGPYKGAPLSLEIITPAVAGPFDLSVVTVRVALYVDQTTAQIHAASDPIPAMLAGIPLDLRSVELELDRPQFTLNPTSCNPMQILGTTTSTSGRRIPAQSRFQVGGCKGLDFKPNLKLVFSGGLRRRGHPAVKAVLTQPGAVQNANLAGASVILPKGMFIDQAHVSNPCTRVQYASGSLPGEGCPTKSILGTAKVWTPCSKSPRKERSTSAPTGGNANSPTWSWHSAARFRCSSSASLVRSAPKGPK